MLVRPSSFYLKEACFPRPGELYGLFYLNFLELTKAQTSLNSVPELLEEIIYPAALDSRAQIAEDIGEMQEQLRKQRSRLRELRVKKEEEPGNLSSSFDADGN